MLFMKVFKGPIMTELKKNLIHYLCQIIEKVRRLMRLDFTVYLVMSHNSLNPSTYFISAQTNSFPTLFRSTL